MSLQVDPPPSSNGQAQGLLPNLPAVSGSGISAAAAAAATTGNAGAEDVDWASVDQVATLVSKTTLAGLQALWRQHAAAMDEHGREFAEKLYESHSRVVRDIAEVKDFDLRRMLSLINAFSGDTRELVLSLLQVMRRRDDEFTQQIYQTSRTAFIRNLRAALEARDAWYREKLRGLRARHDTQLAAVRHSSAVEMQQRQMQLKIALARSLAKSARGEGVLGGLGGPRLGPEASTAAGGASADNASAAAMRNSAAALAAVSAAANSVAGATVGGSVSLSGAGGALGAEAAMLEELFEDANAADQLNRELEASLAKANAEVLELKEKLETVHLTVAEATAEGAQWKSKWAVESTKTDSIKRESMAIISKCEEHVTQLQQQHIAEISQRDYLLQRCRDTIAALEARLAAAGLNGAPGAAGGGAGGDGGKGTGEGAGGGASAGGAAAGVAGEPGVSDIERARDCCGAAVGWCCGP